MWSCLVNIVHFEECEYMLNSAVPCLQIISSFLFGRVLTQVFKSVHAFSVDINFVSSLILCIIKSKHT